MPQNRDDINYFFTRSSCRSVSTVDIISTISDCVISSFYLINNSDSMGYVYLTFENIKTCFKESFISFLPSTSSLRWFQVRKMDQCSCKELLRHSQWIIQSGVMGNHHKSQESVICVNFHAIKKSPRL